MSAALKQQVNGNDKWCLTPFALIHCECEPHSEEDGGEKKRCKTEDVTPCFPRVLSACFP